MELRKLSKLKKYLITVISVILVLLLFTTAYVAYIGWSLIHPKKFTKTYPFTEKYENINFKDSNNTTNLKGLYFENPSNTNKTLIMAHGYGKSMFQHGKNTPSFVTGYYKAGYNIILFDFRNSGQSEGNMTTCGYYEKYDLIGAINYAKKRNPNDDIIIIGFSMGASTSIDVTGIDKRVNYLIADSPFADLGDYLGENLPVWSKIPAVFNPPMIFFMKKFSAIDIGDVSPIKSITKFDTNTKVMLIHSTGDKKIPYSNSINLKNAYAKAGGHNLIYWQLDKSDHVEAFNDQPKEYLRKTIEFLNN